MELFTIQCTTCRARLKVKDEAIIGTILNCPKCSSMVHVVPPVSWKGGESPSVGAESAVAETPASAETALPSAPEAAPTALSKKSSMVASDAVPAAAEPPALPSGAAAESSQRAEPTALPPEAAVTLHGAAPSSEVAWHEALLARAKQDWPMLTGGLTAGVVMGASVWFVLGPTGNSTDQAAFGGNEPTTVASANDTTTPTVQQSEESGEPSGSNEVSQPDASENIVAASALPATEANESDARDRSAVPTPTEVSPEPPDATISPVADDVDEPVVSDAVPPSDEVSDEPALETPTSAEPTQPTVADAKPSIKLDPESPPPGPSDSPLADPFDLNAPGVAPPPSFADAPSAQDEPQETETPAEAPPDDALSEETVDDRMGVILHEVNFVSVPLGQFVAFVGDVTTLPIMIDDGALAAAGKKRTMPVTVHLSDTTAQDALRAALAPLGLTYEVRGKRLFVTVAGSPERGGN